MVDIAPQRNQNSAVGAITLLTAGFCSSGIFGIDGVCTKLKYHSRPIHITPDSDVQPAEEERPPVHARRRDPVPVPSAGDAR